MIGNDIIDLKLARTQSDWKRKGWVDKLYTISEQEYIYNSTHPTRSVWKLWSMKEAAYKAHQRRFSLAPRYNPKSFICSDNTVSVDSYKYTTESTIVDDLYVHTSAIISNANYKIVTFCKDHVSVKECLKDYLAKIYNIKVEDVSIQKDKNNIPNIYIKNNLSNILFSLTAHGNYSGYILRI